MHSSFYLFVFTVTGIFLSIYLLLLYWRIRGGGLLGRTGTKSVIGEDDKTDKGTEAPDRGS
jgi:hypothetical protein